MSQNKNLSIAHVGSLQNEADRVRSGWVFWWLKKNGINVSSFQNDYINLDQGRDFLEENQSYDVVILHHIYNPDEQEEPKGGDFNVSSKHNENEWRNKLSHSGAMYIFVFGGLGEVAVEYLGNISGYKLIKQDSLNGVYQKD